MQWSTYFKNSEKIQIFCCYWKVLKNRLAKEGYELVTNCNQLKLYAK